jgi:hypothetical protein
MHGEERGHIGVIRVRLDFSDFHRIPSPDPQKIESDTELLFYHWVRL